MNKGELLVMLDDELLLRRLQSVTAQAHEVDAELARADKDFRRMERLYEEEAISEKAYDEYKYRLEALRQRASSLHAEVGLIEAEQRRKGVRAPFSGVVVSKSVEKGEWIAKGATVMTVARDDVVEITVNVPERIVPFLNRKMAVEVNSGGRRAEGRIFAIVPKGDTATRSFPVKVRMQNSTGLLEGMEAHIRLPVGPRSEALIVPRDAVVGVFGMNAVFAVVESKAVMIPVKVLGFEGDKAGVLAEGLAPGMQVVIKGNERLRNGQPVSVAGEG